MKDYWIYLVMLLNCIAIALAAFTNQPVELIVLLFILLMATHIVAAVKSKEISNKHKRAGLNTHYIDAMTIICLVCPFIDGAAIALIVFVSTFYS